ncbi:cysteine hydrolase [Novosphingobium profundi]|nr:isochorismatase family cysteine hydrolase [Novosphingobium profundi]MBT0670278.1 cysteine hydrolase [Novosphingobium profundi]
MRWACPSRRWQSRRVAEALAAARRAGLAILHTREGYEENLAQCPDWKRVRARPGPGERGPRGRYMIRGESGHAIIAPCAPLPGEAVFDKPGSGAFHATGLEEHLRSLGIRQLVLCGVTLDCCVLASLFEANDRNFQCLLLGDATGTYDPATTMALLAMLETGVIAQVAQTCAFASGIA